MSIATQTVNDYKLWPGTAPASFRSVTAGGYDVTAVSHGKRRAIGFKELAPSGGAYVASDVVFLLPAVLLGTTKPKPGDQVQDAEATWTVLEAGVGKFGNTFRLICRNLILAAALSRTCSQLRPSQTQDAAGFRTATLSTVASGVACRLQEENLTSGFDQAAAETRREYTLYVGSRLFLRAQDVIRIDSVDYDPVSAGSWDRLDQLGVVKLRRVE